MAATLVAAGCWQRCAQRRARRVVSSGATPRKNSPSAAAAMRYPHTPNMQGSTHRRTPGLGTQIAFGACLPLGRGDDGHKAIVAPHRVTRAAPDPHRAVPSAPSARMGSCRARTGATCGPATTSAAADVTPPNATRTARRSRVRQSRRRRPHHHRRRRHRRTRARPTRRRRLLRRARRVSAGGASPHHRHPHRVPPWASHTRQREVPSRCKRCGALLPAS